MTREEAINVMRGWVLANKDREALETILPELKRDERKRIKENCIHFLELQKSHHASTIEIDECINWLNDLVLPKWLYRLEYKDGTCGLWYNGEGKWCFEEGIGSVEGCKTKDLPMDHDERYKQGGRDWFSSCSRKEDLLHWYSLDDAEELIKKGFVFTRYLATEYHEYKNETVFIKDSSLVREEIDIFELFGKTKPIFKVGEAIIAKEGTCIEKEPFYIDKIENGCYWDGDSSILINNQDEFELYTGWSERDRILPKQKEWCEEDNKMLDAAISFVEHSGFTTIGKGKYATIDWLKSLRNMVLSHPSKKWSEEDENELAIIRGYIKSGEWSTAHIDRALGIIDSIINKMTENREMTTRNEEILKAAHELEYPENVPYFVNGAEWADKHPSKESLRPQSQWKPSEEQMEYLKRAVNAQFYDNTVLEELYNELKKLIE